jgi:hypothetical protein
MEALAQDRAGVDAFRDRAQARLGVRPIIERGLQSRYFGAGVPAPGEIVGDDNELAVAAVAE